MFTFSFSVIKSLKSTGVDVEKVRLAVHSAVEEHKANAERETTVKVKVGKKDTSIGWKDVSKAKATTNAPLQLAYLSQTMDKLDEVGLEPREIELPKALAEWVKKFPAATTAEPEKLVA